MPLMNSYLVPLWFLHFLGLPLRGEDETGSQCRYSSLSDGLLGVPYCIKDVVKEGLHLLKEEGGGTHSKLPQHQHLGKIEIILRVVITSPLWVYTSILCFQTSVRSYNIITGLI